jgi:hypothetical protein
MIYICKYTGIDSVYVTEARCEHGIQYYMEGRPEQISASEPHVYHGLLHA